MAKNYRAELVGVFGDPVEGNPTGVMEEAGFAALGLNWRYLTLKVTPADFDAAIRSLRPLHFRGINLTMPHKITVLPYLDQLSPAAQVIGAVNTVVVREDGLYGDNTDGRGFVEALRREGVSLAGQSVTLLGAGGAAKAIAVECALAGVRRITVVNRNRPRGEALVRTLQAHTAVSAAFLPWSASLAVPEGTGILINATPVGMRPHEAEAPDLDYASVQPGTLAADVAFDPADTQFLARCAARGARTVNGLGMLACQGALNFTLWTGQEAPLEVMRQALAREFEEDQL